MDDFFTFVTSLSCFSVIAVFLLGMFWFWIWMLVDCIQHEPAQGNEKLIWVLVIVLLHWLGALVYYLVRRPQRIREVGK